MKPAEIENRLVDDADLTFTDGSSEQPGRKQGQRAKSAPAAGIRRDASASDRYPEGRDRAAGSVERQRNRVEPRGFAQGRRTISAPTD